MHAHSVLCSGLQVNLISVGISFYDSITRTNWGILKCDSSICELWKPPTQVVAKYCSHLKAGYFNIWNPVNEVQGKGCCSGASIFSLTVKLHLISVLCLRAMHLVKWKLVLIGTPHNDASIASLDRMFC